MNSPSNPTQDLFATRAYVIGEILISLVALTGGGYVFATTLNEGVRLVASGMLSAVLVFWFQRRSSEQANNAVTTLANGQLTTIKDNQSVIKSTLDGVQGTLDRAKIT